MEFALKRTRRVTTKEAFQKRNLQHTRRGLVSATRIYQHEIELSFCDLNPISELTTSTISILIWQR